MKSEICPSCKKIMLKGQVEYDDKLVWAPGQERQSQLRNRVLDGQASVGYWMKIPGWNKWKAEAYLCPDCRIMVLENINTSKLRIKDMVEGETCVYCGEHLILGNMRLNGSKLIWCPENERQFFRKMVTEGSAVAGHYENKKWKWLSYWIIDTYLCPHCRRMFIKNVDVSRL